ncbi:breast cancer anti-estrogen resistance protein 3 homolog isoform X1 [Erpetoichthys calabaricus]|uniref:SH2 domain containing 3A n=2 Tax=Erpetoichthys calabaricus TaxID=27687 RepID=A0A8C4XE86_ERPCA|nr:breast cancer anti-estrogen resistance protein 3 homolog isoform X1 [Erpetoichthys calabaricus]
MSNYSISVLLSQVGLFQYSKVLEKKYCGLEALLYVTDSDLREAGIQSQQHREAILSNIKRHQRRDSHKRGVSVSSSASTTGPSSTTKVRRKHSLASSIDLLKPEKRLTGQSFSLFRQSILPRLWKKERVSSCRDLPTLVETSDSQVQEAHTDVSALVLLCREEKEEERSQQDSKPEAVGVQQHRLTVSAEGRNMEARKNQLKKELEEELKLSQDDLRSHAWYHGRIRPEAAEALLKQDGDFLIRDSTTSHDDYVLTCLWDSKPIHFRIIRIVLRRKQGYTRMLFQFEQDQFDNVPALVRFHVGNRKPVSEKSGAVIMNPVNRTVPLRVIEEERLAKMNPALQPERLPVADPNKRLSLNGSSLDNALTSDSLLRSKEKSGSHPASLETLGRRPSLQSAQSDSNLRAGITASQPKTADREQQHLAPVYRTGSDPLLSPNSLRTVALQPEGGSALRGSDGQLHSRAPPKPLRIPSVIFSYPPVDPQQPPDSNEDPTSHYSEFVPHAPPPPQSHVDRLRVEERWKSRIRMTGTSYNILDSISPPLLDSHREESCIVEEDPPDVSDQDPPFTRPQAETTSSFQLSTFSSLILPENNKPLDPGVIKQLKELFSESDPKRIAFHILKVDSQVIRMVNVSKEQRQKMGVSSGLELITLPHGHQLRVDLLERHHLLALGIAIDILGCTGTVSQRAAVLHKMIQVANELRVTAGDLFAFSAVMKALEMPQILRLEMTWRTLRRSHTESAITFEKKLKPYLKALNEGKDETPTNELTIPHILPLLKLMEGLDLGEHTEHSCELLLRTLARARLLTVNADQFGSQVQKLLADYELNEKLLEVFKTEFALKFFWGSKGAEADQKVRHEKFDQILTVLSRKLEPDDVRES